MRGESSAREPTAAPIVERTADRSPRRRAEARAGRNQGVENMTDALQSSIDAILRKVTSGSPRVPGVVGVATPRHGKH